MEAKQVIKALAESDWSHPSIGNKAIIQAAIELLDAKRGTDEQIEFERKLACEAINGAMAFGYQNTNAPPREDHWLAPFWKIGRQQAELEAHTALAPSDAVGAPQEPVAIIGETFNLFWIGSGPIAPIVEKHGLKVGDKLYAAPVAPAAPELPPADFEQMTPNQRRAVSKGLAALETMADLWAAEVRLSQLALRIAAVPDEPERAARIAAMIEQGFIEGAYRHFLDHKDTVAPAVVAPTDDAPTIPDLASPLTPFGLLVRALRIVAGTTLLGMAQHLSVTPATLSSMEFGRRPVEREMALKIAVYFELLGLPYMFPAIDAALQSHSEGETR